MLYRRKILLALLEKFGGNLKRTEVQKLLFLYCQETDRLYYNFFPYKYGGFSFLIQFDKDVMVKSGALVDTSEYRLRTKRSFFEELKPLDGKDLIEFVSRYKNLRGKKLLKHVYLNFPQYSCRSQIVRNILNPEEIKQIKQRWNLDQTCCLFTVGYEGLTIDAYLNKLISNNINAVIDVRKNPLSMKYGFSKTRMKNCLEKAGIKYFHLPQLGIASDLRKDLNSPAAYQKLFEFYTVQILPQEIESLQKIKDLLQKERRITLTCFEKEFHNCHRHKITEYLSQNFDSKFKVLHL